MSAKPNNCWGWHDIINTHCNVVVLLLYFVINNFFQVSNIFIGLPQTFRPWLLCPNHWWGEWFCPVPMCAQSLKRVWPFRTLPGSSVHGIFPARILDHVAISYSRVFSWLMEQAHACLLCLLHWQGNSLPLSHLGSPPNAYRFALLFFFEWLDY